MPNPDLIPEPFAQSGDKNTIPLERAIADPIYRASWKAGFPPDTRLPKDLGGEAPDGLDFNGVLNILSQAVVFLQKGNAYQFDVSMAPYPVGALVRSNDNLTTYQSTVPNNSNNPNSNMTGWRVYNGKDFLVNDLTTGGTDKALTAEAMKLFYQIFTSLKSSASGRFVVPCSDGKPIIVQWGTVAVNMTTANTINYTPISYSIAYPNGILMCGAFPNNNPASAFITASAEARTNTGFQLATSCGRAFTSDFTYISIGH